MNTVPRPPMLEVKNVSARYESGRSMLGTRRYREVLHDVSLTIGEGETYGLVGESGSGKSTLGRTILRLVPVSSGQIVVDGSDITSWGRSTPRQYRQAVQVVFQNPLGSLNPRMLVRQMLAESVAFHTGARGADLDAQVRALLNDVGLTSRHAERFPHELSGGQQQRVAIARALAPRPYLVICDEAVSALDVSTQAQVIGLLQDLQAQRGLSYLFISHDLGVVEAISHRVGVLRSGRLVEEGTAAEVYRTPRNAYTRDLLAAIPTLPPAA